MFEWFLTDEFIIRSRDASNLGFIELIWIHPYAPIRVMRQAGRKQVIPRVTKMSYFRADFQDNDIPYRCQAQHIWYYKIIVETNNIEPDRDHVGYEPFYPAWLKDNLDRIVKPGIGRVNRVIMKMLRPKSNITDCVRGFMPSRLNIER